MPIATNIIRPVPRPKILTRFTFSSSKTLRIYISVSSQYDTTVDCVISSGDYYVADDMQSDDIIYQIGNEFASELINTHSLSTSEWGMKTYVRASDHKVVFAFIGSNYDASGDNDVKIAWTEQDGAEIGSILGFDTSGDDEKTSEDHPEFTAGDQHAYGWYADEDGYLRNDSAYDIPSVQALLSRAPSGKSKAQHVGTLFDNFLELQHIPYQLMWSDGTDYESTPPWPMNKNEPLECWFREAVQGTPFRVYRNGHIDTSRAIERGTATSGSTNTDLVDTGKSWATGQFNGHAIYVPEFYTITDAGADPTAPLLAYIEDTSSNQIDTPNFYFSNQFDDRDYYVIDLAYGTYVLNTNEMRRLNPSELEDVPRYDIRIPLWRFVE